MSAAPASAPARDRRSALRRSARRLRSGITAVTAWLHRPLSSFHLVLAIFGLLTAFGLVMVLSASSVEALDASGSSYSVFRSQLIFVGIGLALAWVAMRIPVRLLRQWSPLMLGASVLALALVLTPLGTSANGAQSWFVVAGLSLQPVEPAKVALAMWGAHVLVLRRSAVLWRQLLVPLVPVALLIFALVMLQPDLGSTVTLGVVLLALLWFAGMPMRLFLSLLTGALVTGAVLATVAGYRMSRITSFLNPNADPLDSAFQARQALYSLADGGLFGVGLGQGRAKWRYLPNAHNDFIFAVIGEELGFLGAALVLVLFALLAYVGMRVATKNLDPWIRVLAATLTTWIVTQAAINIGYVVGLLPVTGLPLPLISAGGSSTIITMLAFGLLANFARHEPAAVSALRSQGPGRIGALLRLPTPEPYRPTQGRNPTQGRSTTSNAPRKRPTGPPPRRPHGSAAHGRQR